MKIKEAITHFECQATNAAGLKFIISQSDFELLNRIEVKDK